MLARVGAQIDATSHRDGVGCAGDDDDRLLRKARECKVEEAFSSAAAFSRSSSDKSSKQACRVGSHCRLTARFPRTLLIEATTVSASPPGNR